MTYNLDEIEQSQEIFSYLLQYHELSERTEKELYKSFIESDAVQLLVRSQAACSDLQVERYENVIYIMPNDDNYFLGFSKSDLKRKLCRSNADDIDYYLSLFVIMILILKFYDGYGTSCKIRDYIKVGDLQNSVSEYLKKGAAVYTEEEQNENGILFTELSQSYESLRSSEKISHQRTTKEGFIYTILIFLERQGLIQYIKSDEMIKTTSKFDHFMNWNLLDKNNYERVQNIMKDIDVKNSIIQDTSSKNTLKEDTLKEDTLKEDTLKEDTLKEDTLKENTSATNDPVLERSP